MSNLDIIRAWKDSAYRQSLSQEQQTALPEHPAGEIELSEEELQGVEGADLQPTTTVQTTGPVFDSVKICFTFTPGCPPTVNSLIYKTTLELN